MNTPEEPFNNHRVIRLTSWQAIGVITLFVLTLARGIWGWITDAISFFGSV